MKDKLMTIKEIEKLQKKVDRGGGEMALATAPDYFLTKEEIKDLCFYQHSVLAKMQRIKNEKNATRSLKAYFDDWEEKIEKLNDLLAEYKELVKTIERNISGRMCWNEAMREADEEIQQLRA